MAHQIMSDHLTHGYHLGTKTCSLRCCLILLCTIQFSSYDSTFSSLCLLVPSLLFLLISREGHLHSLSLTIGSWHDLTLVTFLTKPLLSSFFLNLKTTFMFLLIKIFPLLLNNTILLLMGFYTLAHTLFILFYFCPFSCITMSKMNAFSRGLLLSSDFKDCPLMQQMKMQHLCTILRHFITFVLPGLCRETSVSLIQDFFNVKSMSVA